MERLRCRASPRPRNAEGLCEHLRNDVSKRSDLSGFYSNLLNNTLAPDTTQPSAAMQRALEGMKRAEPLPPSAAARSGGSSPPSQQVEPPGQGADHPGQGADSPGQGANPPGQEANPPGQEANPPRQGANPPGQDVDPPSQRVDPSGQLVEQSLASAIFAATRVEAPPAFKPPEPPTTWQAPMTVRHEKRNDIDDITSARERYLARKAMRNS
ncbi:MAG: hypothetical protein SGPRY_011816 [Prymnesium sp.]